MFEDPFNEPLITFIVDVETTALDDDAYEDFTDRLSEIIRADNCNKIFEPDNFSRGGYEADGEYHRYRYIDGEFSEGALEDVEDLLAEYGLKVK